MIGDKIKHDDKIWIFVGYYADLRIYAHGNERLILDKRGWEYMRYIQDPIEVPVSTK
jgi:hypothetical protein